VVDGWLYDKLAGCMPTGEKSNFLLAGGGE